MKAKEQVLFKQVVRKPRKIRSDAKLANLTEEQQQMVEKWLEEEGQKVCEQRILKELGISVSHSSLWSMVQRWRSRACYLEFERDARQQVEQEAERIGGMSFAEMEEAVDRKFIMRASKGDNAKLYKEMRYLRIADKTAKNGARIAEAKLKQDDKKLAQRNKALKLAERKVVLHERKIEEATKATENQTLSAEERAQRIREILGE